MWVISVSVNKSNFSVLYPCSDGLIYCVPSGAHILNSCKAP
nr:MAG TPA: hypothetical protein [Inoviridae sp.]